MKKGLAILFIILQSNTFSVGQTGTAADPYIGLSQAWLVPSSGIYHFNINGTTFSSYVEQGSGWILAASGNSNTTESSYATTSSLTLQSDELLPASIYSSTLVTDVRMNATSGPSLPFDVQSSNANVLDNLQNDRTLSVNTNNTDWTGTGTASLARNCSSNSGSLSTHIYHACGNAGNMHWQVGKNNSHEKLDFSNSTKNDLNLWIRAISMVFPVELLNFNTIPLENNFVKIEWQTGSETNNENFTIQRSRNAIDWENLTTIAGEGNSSSLLNYSYVDSLPFSGTSYYRLKQMDFNGPASYSKINSVNISESDASLLTTYPNPIINQVTVLGSSSELKNIKVFNEFGQDVTLQTQNIEEKETSLVLDLSNLKKGFYYIKSKNATTKVYKYSN